MPQRGEMEGGGSEGIYVYIPLIHIVVEQKLTQHCKAIILQFKNKNLHSSLGGRKLPLQGLPPHVSRLISQHPQFQEEQIAPLCVCPCWLSAWTPLPPPYFFTARASSQNRLGLSLDTRLCVASSDPASISQQRPGWGPSTKHPQYWFSLCILECIALH